MSRSERVKGATGVSVLVATWDDGLFVVDGTRCRHELAGEPVCGLTADGRGGALAIVGGHSLRRRSADGKWHTLAEDTSPLACVAAVDDKILVGTNDGARLLCMVDGGPLEPLPGFDAVAGRDKWFAGTFVIEGKVVGPPLGVRSLSGAPDGGRLHAAVHVGGIPRSTDGGVSWQPTLDIESDVHEVCIHPTCSGIVAAATAVGLGLSRDGGASWTFETEGLHAPYCSAVAFAGDDVLVAASVHHFASEGAVYRRALDGGSSLAPVAVTPSSWTVGIVDTGCIAVLGSVLAVADGGNLYVSHDAGHTWARVADDIPDASALLLA